MRRKILVAAWVIGITALGVMAFKDTAATAALRAVIASSVDFPVRVDPARLESPSRIFAPFVYLSHPEAALEFFDSDIQLRAAAPGRIRVTIRPAKVRMSVERFASRWTFLNPILRMELSGAGTGIEFEGWHSGETRLEGAARAGRYGFWEWIDVRGRVDTSVLRGLVRRLPEVAEERGGTRVFRMLYRDETATLWINEKIAFRAKWKLSR